MSQTEFAVNFFVALFALIDPVGNVPLFAAATAGVKARDRAWISLYISLFVFVFLTFFYFTGLSLLQFFGISLPAFRIAGGVILFLLGLEMARDDFSASGAGAADGVVGQGRAFVRKRFEMMIVPFAMPAKAPSVPSVTERRSSSLPTQAKTTSWLEAAVRGVVAKEPPLALTHASALAVVRL